MKSLALLGQPGWSKIGSSAQVDGVYYRTSHWASVVPNRVLSNALGLYACNRRRGRPGHCWSSTVCRKSSHCLGTLGSMPEHATHRGPQRMPRRSALGRLFGAATGLVLAGCGFEESGPTASASGAAQRGGELALSDHVVEVWRDPG